VAAHGVRSPFHPLERSRAVLTACPVRHPALCTAVGFQAYNPEYTPSQNDQFSQNLVEQWNGTAFSNVTVPDPTPPTGTSSSRWTVSGRHRVWPAVTSTPSRGRHDRPILAWNGFLLGEPDNSYSSPRAMTGSTRSPALPTCSLRGGLFGPGHPGAHGATLPRRLFTKLGSDGASTPSALPSSTAPRAELP